MIDCTTEQSRRAPYASAKELTPNSASRVATMSAADSYRGPPSPRGVNGSREQLVALDGRARFAHHALGAKLVRSLFLSCPPLR